MKIALVTFEFEGLTKNGGIGTAYRRLAELLAKQGHKITVVFMPFNWKAKLEKNSSIPREIAKLKRQGIHVVLPGEDKPPASLVALPFQLKRSMRVYNYLKTQQFDVVHAADNGGLVYFSLLAKKSKLEFLNCQFVIGAHGSLIWAAEANRLFSEDAILTSHFDQQSIEMADYLISPSAYMIDYMKKKSWKLPENTEVIPNINDLSLSKRSSPFKNWKKNTPMTVVFFGRLENRKGIFVFSEAIERLLEQNERLGVTQPFKMVILGSECLSAPDYSPVSGWLKNRFRRFRNRIQISFISDFSSQQSMEYLSKTPNQLVVMPSLLDNSPYVVVEAIELGLNFLTTDSGGQAELIHPSHHKAVLCEPEVESLQKAIGKRLAGPPIAAQPSPQAAQANQAWLEFHARLGKKRRVAEKPERAPQSLVTVVLGLNPQISSDETFFSLGSILKQNYPYIEILMPEGFGQRHNFKIPEKSKFAISQFNINQSTSHWFSAVQAAKGKYILFLDCARLAGPSTLMEWVRAAEAFCQESQSIAVSGIAENRFSEHSEWFIPMSNDFIPAMLEENQIDIFALWDRSRLLKLNNKSQMDLSGGPGTNLFFSALFASGEKFGIFPQVVVSALPLLGSMQNRKQKDQLSRIEAFLDSPSMDWRRLAYYAAGIHSELERLRREYHNIYKENNSDKNRKEIVRLRAEQEHGKKELERLRNENDQRAEKIVRLEKMKSDIQKAVNK